MVVKLQHCSQHFQWQLVCRLATAAAHAPELVPGAAISLDAALRAVDSCMVQRLPAPAALDAVSAGIEAAIAAAAWKP